jgi:hypothetical protein
MRAMSLHTAQILVALAGSIIMLLAVPAKLFPAIAVLATGLEALLDFRVINFSVRGVNLTFVLAVTIIVCAVIVWTRNAQKAAVSAATAVTLIGATQLFTTLS